jgi:hypothetical protein
MENICLLPRGLPDPACQFSQAFEESNGLGMAALLCSVERGSDVVSGIWASPVIQQHPDHVFVAAPSRDMERLHSPISLAETSMEKTLILANQSLYFLLEAET